VSMFPTPRYPRSMIRRPWSAALAAVLAVAGLALLAAPQFTTEPGPRRSHPGAIEATLFVGTSPVAYRSGPDPIDERWAKRTDSSRLPLLALLCGALLTAGSSWFARVRDVRARWTAVARIGGVSARAPPVAR
jgi:hypothetical protein